MFLYYLICYNLNGDNMNNTILKIENLTKYYEKVLGVKDLSLELTQGEVFGFIGPNGAGKSTTIRSIMNLINKTSGKVYFNDKELTSDDIELKRLIGYLPSEINLYEDLTVKQMIDYHESFYKENLSERRKYLVELLKLDETKKVDELSLGNSKKLGIVLAFLHNPKLLILDEPTSGLDPIMQQTFYKLLEEEKQKGTTIFYSTHLLNEVSSLCDRVGIIKEGTLLNVESIEDLKRKNLNVVTIESNEINEIINDLSIGDYKYENNKLVFKNNKTPNELIKILSKYDIKNILIEEATLEDIFLHYYQ